MWIQRDQFGRRIIVYSSRSVRPKEGLRAISGPGYSICRRIMKDTDTMCGVFAASGGDMLSS